MFSCSKGEKSAHRCRCSLRSGTFFTAAKQQEPKVETEHSRARHSASAGPAPAIAALLQPPIDTSVAEASRPNLFRRANGLRCARYDPGNHHPFASLGAENVEPV